MEKIEIISFKRSRWFEKYINFKTQKRIIAKNDFEEDFYKLLKISIFGKTMENVRNRVRLEILKKYEYENFIKQQSKLTSNGIHKPSENCDSYTFKQNEVLMDTPIYLGFAVLENIYARNIILKLLMYGTS